MAAALYPWQHAAWDALAGRLRRQQVPNALLIAGPAGVGKSVLAAQLVAALLCESPEPASLQACGHCRSCRMVDGDGHPDSRTLTPEEDKASISIDQIRDIVHFLNLTPQYGASKVITVTPADVLTLAAANSLLKTLEEPPAGGVLILVSERPATLPATVRSRCQAVRVNRPPRDQAIMWLQQRLTTAQRPQAALYVDLAQGRPLQALQLAEQQDLLACREAVLGGFDQIISGGQQVISIAEQWLKFGLKESLYWIDSWLVDMVRLKAGGEQPPGLANPDLSERLLTLAAGCTLQRLLELQQLCVGIRREAHTTLNPALVIETLAIQLARKTR
ncbi:MAG: DNA polymerase III subunit delta' [Gammaproteobacteria bacterium]|nr:DNA polymerase III subunit delta' [Gammaproteobacteria bacterium]